MKIKENVLLFGFAGLVFFIAYLLFAGLPLEKEIQFIPKWTIDIQDKYVSFIHEKEKEDLTSSSVSDAALPFKLAQYLGYITPSGDVPFIFTFPERASISESFWTSYTSSASGTPVYSASSASSFTIEDSGFPHIVDNTVYLFYPGGNSFGRYSTEGKKLWSADHWSPITSFASSSAGTACGYADGDLRFFNTNGELVFSMYPGGSSFEVILGVDISSDGSYIAAVCGLEKQRFVLIQINGKNSKIVYHAYLDSQKREQTYVHFNKAGNRVFFNYDGGLGVVDCGQNTMKKIPVKGSVCSISELESGTLSFVLCQDKQTWTVLALESFSNLMGSFSFTADNAFMSVSGNDLFIGRDSKISKMEIVKK